MSASKKPFPVVGVFEFSNFQPFEFEDAGIVYPTVEHYYQAMKTTDKSLQRRIAAAEKPGYAKAMGKRIPSKMFRNDWMKIREFVMKSALNVKFYEGTEYHDRLMEIWYPLVEYNRWHDNFWGHCMCSNCIKKPYENRLGKMLDDIRLQWQFEYHRRQKLHMSLSLEDF